MKFILWAILLFIFMFLAQTILPFLFLMLVGGKADEAQSTAETSGQPVFSVKPRQGAVALLCGMLAGLILGFGICALTWNWVSSHWFPQLVVALGFFLTAGAGQRAALGGGMFDPGTDRLIAAAFGGYMWGGILGLVAYRVLKLVV